MICASCELEVPEGGVICPRCNEVEPRSGDAPDLSHHDLASTVRRLKGMVMASLVFGLFVAPFAIYSATKALHRYREAALIDPAVRRQIILLRRIAVGLLIFWAFFLGVELSAWLDLSK